MTNRTTLLLATAVAVLFLGAGCTKEQSAPSPTASPAPQSAPVADVPSANAPLAGLVAPAPTSPPPPDTPSVPSAPPSIADVIAPTPPPTAVQPTAPTRGPGQADSQQPQAPPSRSPVSGVETAPASAAESTRRVIRVTAKQWEFVPAEIRVKKGERVILEVTSTDVDHGLSIPDFNINRNLRPGATERIEFTPEKTGSFNMICSVFCGGGHRGMRGTLIVE